MAVVDNKISAQKCQIKEALGSLLFCFSLLHAHLIDKPTTLGQSCLLDKLWFFFFFIFFFF